MRRIGLIFICSTNQREEETQDKRSEMPMEIKNGEIYELLLPRFKFHLRFISQAKGKVRREWGFPIIVSYLLLSRRGKNENEAHSVHKMQKEEEKTLPSPWWDFHLWEMRKDKRRTGKSSSSFTPYRISRETDERLRKGNFTLPARKVGRIGISKEKRESLRQREKERVMRIKILGGRRT